jgi:copper homeostasis protein
LNSTNNHELKVKTMSTQLEICCYSPDSAYLAWQAGADRIELCDNYFEGGTTPSFGAIRKVLDFLTIPVNILIRPRGGDFCYSKYEHEAIKEDVLMVKKMGANGVVVGFLTPDGYLDQEKTKEIVLLADGMEVTFHRAFDMCLDADQALEQLIDLGVNRVLTSGKAQRAWDGKDHIRQWIKQANGRISIMPGSGIHDGNIKEIAEYTRAKEFHSSAMTFIPSIMKHVNPQVSMGKASEPKDEYRKVSVNQAQIKAMKQIIS